MHACRHVLDWFDGYVSCVVRSWKMDEEWSKQWLRFRICWQPNKAVCWLLRPMATYVGNHQQKSNYHLKHLRRFYVLIASLSFFNDVASSLLLFSTKYYYQCMINFWPLITLKIIIFTTIFYHWQPKLIERRV